MSDPRRLEEEYEPAEIDPDDPIETAPREPRRPDDVNDADWLDQERDVPIDDDRSDGGSDD